MELSFPYTVKLLRDLGPGEICISPQNEFWIGLTPSEGQQQGDAAVFLRVAITDGREPAFFVHWWKRQSLSEYVLSFTGELLWDIRPANWGVNLDAKHGQLLATDKGTFLIAKKAGQQFLNECYINLSDFTVHNQYPDNAKYCADQWAILIRSSLSRDSYETVIEVAVKQSPA